MKDFFLFVFAQKKSLELQKNCKTERKDCPYYNFLSPAPLLRTQLLTGNGKGCSVRLAGSVESLTRGELGRYSS